MTGALTRRAAFRSIGLGAAMSTIAAGTAAASVCTPPGDDAELIRIGEEFDRLHAEWLPLYAEHKRCAKLRDTAWETGGFKFSLEAYGACCDWAGVTAVEDAEAAVLARLDELSERILALPARTFAGLAVKLRVVRFAAFPGQDADGDPDELNWDLRCFMLVQLEVDALAAGGAL